MWLQRRPFLAPLAWEKCCWSQYSWVRAQGAEGSPWYFGKGGTDTLPTLAGEQQFKEANVGSGGPQGRRGLVSSQGSSGGMGKKQEPDPKRKGMEGSFTKQAWAGACAARGPARQPQTGGAELPGGAIPQRDIIPRRGGPGPAPALAPPGLQLFSTSCCLPWQPAQSWDPAVPSLPVLCGLKAIALVGRRVWQIRRCGRKTQG